MEWLSFSKETFERARTEKKPVFLHVGFKSCHWCHVMERESFHDPAIQDMLSNDFLAVSVDREARPDVDAVYQAACLASGHGGGWPLTALLLPNQQPFFVATYLDRQTLTRVLETARTEWRKNRSGLSTLGQEFGANIRALLTPQAAPMMPGVALFAQAARALFTSFDAQHGGFGTAPKFPMAHTLAFLIRYQSLTKDPATLAMAEQTLTAMAEGALFDHVGGGFFRYAVDDQYREVHYEKLLIDNALLADVYVEAFQATGRPLYRNVAERTLSYLLREMALPGGGFASAQDADSDGIEGGHYRLSHDELTSVLGAEDADAFARYYGITDSSMPQRIGHAGGIETPRMRELCAQVLLYRRQRCVLPRYDTVVTSWNGATLAAFSRAFSVTGNRVYLEAAVRIATFARRTLLTPEGTLAHQWTGDTTEGAALLEDVATLANGVLCLYRATLENTWLTFAVSLARMLVTQFGEPKQGLYTASTDHAPALVNPKETYDGATPCGNAMALNVFQTLTRLDVGTGWHTAAHDLAHWLAGALAEAPNQHLASLSAMLPLVYPARLLETRAGYAQNLQLLTALQDRYDPLLYIKATEQAAGAAPFRLCAEERCLPPFATLSGVLRAL